MSWTHYKSLLSLNSQEKLEFYLEEAVKNNWTLRQMHRQVASQLYERLLLGTDKDKILSVARNENHPTELKDIVKDPLILEFLGLKQEASYFEKDLESALITHLRNSCWSWVMGFPLWRGKGEFISMVMTFLSPWYSTIVCFNALLSSS